MSIIGWIVLGLIVGFVGSRVINKFGDGVLLDLLLGVIGALAGGGLFNVIGHADITGFNLYSMIAAVVGSVIALLAYHAIARR